MSGNSLDIEEILVDSVSLTTNPARVAATPVDFPGQLRDREG